MIDPGHGGHDPGTMNRRTGAREKDIVLRVGRYLKEELDRRGNVKAFLTRDDDRFIRLQDRPHMAISRNANLFLSIHVNAEPGGGRKARGVETYFLSPARSEESKRVAARENSVVELEDGSAPAGVDRLELVLATMDQDSHVTESRRFAGYVQNRYRDALRAADRGVKPGPFWVLVGASTNMPAILTEIGFITNTEDERRLTSEKGQREIARALADTVEEYAREYERRTSSFARGGE
jgi:N-acetylmuramoyl-L-alanine amidase